MNEVRGLTEQLSDSANEFWMSVGDYLPKLLGALILLIVALIVAKLLQAAVTKLLNAVGVDRFMQNETVAKSLKTAEVDIDFVSIAGRIVFWVVLIIFGIAISDVLELTAMSDIIRDIIDYIPNVLAAVIVITITVAGARLVRDVITTALARMRVDFARKVASLAYFVLLVFGTLMAIDQLGFDTTILTANITIIVAGIVLALALAFGLGGRETAGRIIDDMYSSYKQPAKRKRR